MLQAGFGPERVESGARTRAHPKSFAKMERLRGQFRTKCCGARCAFTSLSLSQCRRVN